MQLIEPRDIQEFERILRRHHLARSDFSLNAIDTTDPKTDEVPALQGELTVQCKSTGQARHYFLSDSTSWLDVFRSDVAGGAFVVRIKRPQQSSIGGVTR